MAVVLAVCSPVAEGATPTAPGSCRTAISPARAPRPERPSTRATSRGSRSGGGTRLTAKANYSGTFASTPVADDETVYIQDLQSNVHALDRATGKLRWVHRFRALNEGPNGLAVDRRRVYGATDSDAFALSAATGRQLWSRHLTSATEQFVDIAPVVWEGLVFTSTVGFPPGGRGAIYALDAATGAVRWKFDTIRDPWQLPARGRRRWALVPGLGRRRGAALRGELEPAAVGRVAGASERRRIPRPRARTRTRCSCSTREAAGCSGTTR